LNARADAAEIRARQRERSAARFGKVACDREAQSGARLRLVPALPASDLGGLLG
jgi:hypothetical protein